MVFVPKDPTLHADTRGACTVCQAPLGIAVRPCGCIFWCEHANEYIFNRSDFLRMQESWHAMRGYEGEGEHRLVVFDGFPDTASIASTLDQFYHDNITVVTVDESPDFIPKNYRGPIKLPDTPIFRPKRDSGPCMHCRNPAGIFEYSCGCLAWCMRCYPERYEVNLITSLMRQLHDALCLGRNYRDYRHHSLTWLTSPEQSEDVWQLPSLVDVEHDDVYVLDINGGRIMVIEVDESNRIIGYPSIRTPFCYELARAGWQESEETMRHVKTINGCIKIANCGCSAYCDEHNENNFIRQREAFKLCYGVSIQRPCFRPIVSKHGWLTELCQRPPLLTDEPVEQPVCMACEGTGRFVRNCGCYEWCVNCHRDEWLKQPVKLLFCFRVTDRADWHGWLDKNGPDPFEVVLPKTFLLLDDITRPESTSSCTVAGYGHRIFASHWPLGKAERLLEFCAQNGAVMTRRNDGLKLSYPDMISRETAIEKHRILLDYLGHDPARLNIHPVRIPTPDEVDERIEISDRFLDRVGFELEGNWNTVPDGFKLYHDGSVSRRLAHAGELHVITYARKIRWDMVERAWPEESDGSCGLHIHLSFRGDKIYSRFVCREFVDWFRQALIRFGRKTNVQNQEFWRRLDGRNGYCIPEYYGDVQLVGNGNRYTQINFAHSKHETIEVRVLPMFKTLKEAKPVVEHVLKCFEVFAMLNSHPVIASEATEIASAGNLARAKRREAALCARIKESIAAAEAYSPRRRR